MREVSRANWVTFIADASRDARDAGWLLHATDDASLVCVAATYTYTIPEPFAYIERLLIEETLNNAGVYVREVPMHQWTPRLNTDLASFEFSTITELPPGKHIKIVGQKRPTIYTSVANMIDSGMESFLRERTLYFGFRFMGAGVSELSRWRQVMAQQAWQSSEQWLRRHPQEFRAYPSAVYVPGR